jgi:hypothetical protein
MRQQKLVGIYSLPCVFAPEQSTSMTCAAHVFLTFESATKKNGGEVFVSGRALIGLCRCLLSEWKEEKEWWKSFCGEMEMWGKVKIEFRRESEVGIEVCRLLVASAIRL